MDKVFNLPQGVLKVLHMSSRYKNSLLAVFWSILSPGLGQIYLGRIKRGVTIFIILFIIQFSEALYLVNPNTHGALDSLHIPNFLILILYISNLVDAFRLGYRTEGLTYGKRCIVIWLSIIFISIGCALYIRTNIIQPFKVPAASMSPTILEGDHIFVDKRAYKKDDPKRGDIVVFVYPQDSKKNFIKRIIGLPNESIEIRSGSIFINGLSITQPEVFKKVYYYNRGNYGAEGQVLHIPPDNYFVLGDYSSSSYDSRYWGFVPKRNILGKAYKIFLPDDRSGPIQ